MKTATRRKAVPFAIAVVAMLALTGCGADAAAGGAASEECTPEAPCELSVRWWGGDERQARQLEVFELFEAQNPDIRISPQPMSFDGYFDQLGVEMAARNAPDVFTLGGSWPLEYGSRGGLADLRTVTSLDLSPFSDEITMGAQIGDELFGVPNGGNASAVVVNRDLFAQAGIELPDETSWTWDDYTRIATEISANTPDGVFGAESRPHDLLGPFSAQRNGYGMFAPDGTIAVDAETLAEFFQMQLDLIDSGGLPPATLYTELVNAGPEESLMGRGLSAMLILHSNQISALSDASGADLALMRIPGDFSGDHVGSNVVISQWWSMSAHTRYPEAAGRLIDFMVNDPEAGAIMGTDRGNPLNEAVGAHIAPDLTPVQKEQVDFMARIGEHAAQGVPQPPGAGEHTSVTQRAVDEVIFGRLTPAQAAEQWLAQMQAALDAAA